MRGGSRQFFGGEGEGDVFVGGGQREGAEQGGVGGAAGQGGALVDEDLIELGFVGAGEGALAVQAGLLELGVEALVGSVAFERGGDAESDVHVLELRVTVGRGWAGEDGHAGAALEDGAAVGGDEQNVLARGRVRAGERVGEPVAVAGLVDAAEDAADELHLRRRGRDGEDALRGQQHGFGGRNKVANGEQNLLAADFGAVAEDEGFVDGRGGLAGSGWRGRHGLGLRLGLGSAGERGRQNDERKETGEKQRAAAWGGVRHGGYSRVWQCRWCGCREDAGVGGNAHAPQHGDIRPDTPHACLTRETKFRLSEHLAGRVMVFRIVAIKCRRDCVRPKDV